MIIILAKLRTGGSVIEFLFVNLHKGTHGNPRKPTETPRMIIIAVRPDQAALICIRKPIFDDWLRNTNLLHIW